MFFSEIFRNNNRDAHTQISAASAIDVWQDMLMGPSYATPLALDRAGITLSDLTWIRPANGLPPGCEPLLLGAVLRRPVSKGEPVQLEDIQCRRAA